MSEPRAIAADLISEKSGTGYPEPFRGAVAGRRWRALGDAFGLTDFGVNLCTLPPGTASSQRHWHTEEDELVYMLDGELTLVTDAGAPAARAGDGRGLRQGAGGRAPSAQRERGAGAVPGRGFTPSTATNAIIRTST